ncbi:hypothetical protein HMI56_003557 [Coelomomyces lativittatus]|nr:hypothetical protein HMI56_003557 [Coelomomyces lativittatus]
MSPDPASQCPSSKKHRPLSKNPEPLQNHVPPKSSKTKGVQTQSWVWNHFLLWSANPPPFPPHCFDTSLLAEVDEIQENHIPEPSPLLTCFPDSGPLSSPAPQPTSFLPDSLVSEGLPELPERTSTNSSTLNWAFPVITFHIDNLPPVSPPLQVPEPPIIPSFQEQTPLPSLSSSALECSPAPEPTQIEVLLPEPLPSSPPTPITSTIPPISSPVLSPGPRRVLKCISLKKAQPSPSHLSPQN